ncbi:TRAP transporter substrate-binding protein [Roseinatronobacter sp.]|uniref:TRAP transporter substrate-binding protein n=1 Tax=Roseinatronobacter sp. TaxID=1945755 RepID=UPI0025E818B5|nr:TRAP transporter substrate-binding protein [Rhodobaca sp.]
MKRALVATIVASVVALPAIASATTLRFGHVGGPGSLFEATANHFAACVAEQSEGAVEVQTFGSSQLGNDNELLQLLRLGQVDFSLPSTVMSSVDGRFGVFEMPYIIADRDHMLRVWDTLGDMFQEAAQANAYHIVGLAENGFRHITNNIRPINVPSDLRGIKLRTPAGEWRVRMFREYGANPTPMALSDVFTALQTGVMDGQENPYAQIASSQFQEVQKYLSITNHVYTPAFILASQRHFNAHSEDVQAVLNDCAAETTTFTYAKAQELEDSLLEVIEAAGVEINEADRDAFVEASQAVFDAFASEIEGGQELIDTVLGLADAS